MVQAVVKVQKNKNITLPMWVIRRFHVGPGDFVQLQGTRQGILMKPSRLMNPSEQQEKLFRLLDKLEGRSKPLGLTEADVSREIKAYRKGRRAAPKAA